MGSDGIGENFHQHAEDMRLDLRKGEDMDRIMCEFKLVIVEPRAVKYVITSWEPLRNGQLLSAKCMILD